MTADVLKTEGAVKLPMVETTAVTFLWNIQQESDSKKDVPHVQCTWMKESAKEEEMKMSHFAYLGAGQREMRGELQASE